MKIHDISMAIHKDMSVYKNYEEKRPKIFFVKKMPEDSINETQMNINVHTGTHIDAKKHMINDESTTDSLELKKLIRPCQVLDLTNVIEKITKEDLEKKEIVENGAVLLKTSNSFLDPIPTDFVYLDESGAKYLSDKNIEVVGIDSLGIERNQKDHATHKILMNKDAIIIEGLVLNSVNEGFYEMIALPLKIKGVDGALARVVLIEK